MAMDCWGRQDLEFRLRRLWCLAPHLSRVNVATAMGMSEAQLQARLQHITPLNYWSICAHGLWRMRTTNCANGRMVGFPNELPPQVENADSYSPGDGLSERD